MYDWLTWLAAGAGYVLAQAVPNAVGGLVAAVAHRLIWRRDGGGPTT